jgi:hypothetical protein
VLYHHLSTVFLTIHARLAVGGSLPFFRNEQLSEWKESIGLNKIKAMQALAAVVFRGKFKCQRPSTLNPSTGLDNHGPIEIIMDE